MTTEEAKQKGFPDGGGTYLIDGKEMRVHCDEYHMHSFGCLVHAKKQLLKLEDVDGKMTWTEVLKYYWPEMTPLECHYVIWNETCYPFSSEMTLQQINERYETEAQETVS